MSAAEGSNSIDFASLRFRRAPNTNRQEGADTVEQSQVLSEGDVSAILGGQNCKQLEKVDHRIKAYSKEAPMAHAKISEENAATMNTSCTVY